MSDKPRAISPYHYSKIREGQVSLERRTLYRQFLPLPIIALLFSYFRFGLLITSIITVLAILLGMIYVSYNPFKIIVKSNSATLFFRSFWGRLYEKSFNSDSVKYFKVITSRNKYYSARFFVARIYLVLNSQSKYKLYDAILSSQEDVLNNSKSLATSLAETMGVSIHIEEK